MRILVLLLSVFASVLAWLPPERCQQTRTRRDVGDVVNVPVVPSIEEALAKQRDLLTKLYKDSTFPGVPLRATCDRSGDIEDMSMYTAYNCAFYTYAPRLAGSVGCYGSDTCTLSRSVATTDSYTASEGYNWGVKLSAKWTILKDVFEVGAEASGGGTYSCAYTKGRTTTQSVACSVSNGRTGQLQLYNILTDMKCDFGTIPLELDTRDDNKAFVDSGPGFLTRMEALSIIESAATLVLPCSNRFFIDPSKISDRLFQKIMRQFPLYDPFTDLVSLNVTVMYVNYRKRGTPELDYTKIIPFTNENGDAVYQYVCLFTE